MHDSKLHELSEEELEELEPDESQISDIDLRAMWEAFSNTDGRIMAYYTDSNLIIRATEIDEW